MWMARRLKAERRRAARARVAGAVVCLALGCAIAGAASAAQVSESHKGSLDDAVRYLQEAQNGEGGWGGSSGSEANADFTAWAALALAGAGINPQEQARPGGASAYAYLAHHTDQLRATTDYELALLVVDASGTAPREFGGVDLVERILDSQIDKAGPEDGGFLHEAGDGAAGVNDTIFAILALSPSARTAETGVAQAVARAATWLLGEQDSDGSWPSVCPKTACGEGKDNVEMTGAALEALHAAGLHDTAAQAEALAFLHHAQNPDGGFPEVPGEHESNVASTAWVLQGLWAAGQNPEAKEWQQPGGREALSYVESLQHGDGSIQWKASSDQNPVWMTAYAGAALEGLPYPIPEPPPPANPPPSPSNPSPTPEAPSAPEPGQGGNSPQSGGGVIVGGGGAGAPLFSRPQPQSLGHTRGGVRELTKTARSADAAGHGVPAPQSMTGPAQAAPKSGPRVGDHGRAEGTGQKVTGVVLGDSLAAFRGPLQDGAPGLHGAGAGGVQSPWLALAIALLAGALALLGAHLERRRPGFVP